MVSKPASAPQLVIIEGKDKGKVITLQDGTAVIGRSKGDVLLQDPRVSRSHVAIHYDAKSGKVTFTDLKSLNGTTVNGDAAETGELKDGDKLQIGNTTFDCQVSARPDGDEASFAPPSEITPSRSQSNRKEPELSPLGESEPAPTARARGGRGDREQRPQEPSVGTILNEEDGGHHGLTGLRAAYLRIPSRVRNTSLVALLVVLLFGMLGRGGRSGSLDRDLASVKKLEEAGKISEAVSKAEALKSQFPNNSKTFMTLGDLYTLQGKNDQAIAAYQKAHDMKPDQPLVHTRLLRVFLRAGMTQEAEQELQHVESQIKDGPQTKEVFVEAARLFLEFKELKQPPEKTLILARALQNSIAPDSSTGYILEAQTLFQMNQAHDAIAVMEKGLKVDPQDEWLLENLVFARLATKDTAGAAATVENWIKLKPGATKPLLVMSYLKYTSKDYQAAIPFIQKIMEIAATTPNEPHHPEALYLMGQIYTQLNRPGEALQFYKKSCEAGFAQGCDNDLVKSAANASPSGSPAPAGSNPGTSSPPQPASLPNGTGTTGGSAPDSGSPGGGMTAPSVPDPGGVPPAGLPDPGSLAPPPGGAGNVPSP